jgi:hypothetical protein
MARKGKNKKNRKVKRRRYNQKEFREVFCISCGMCHKNVNPVFCYVELYRLEPRRFVNFAYKNIVDVRRHFESTGKLLGSMSVEQFANIFCITGICHKGDFNKGLACPTREDCYKLFRSQMGVGSHMIIHDDLDSVKKPVNVGGVRLINNRKKQRRKKRQHRYVAQAYPTFFSSQNEKFQKAIRTIIDGDNNIKQDKDKESAGLHEGAAGGDSKD